LIGVKNVNCFAKRPRSSPNFGALDSMYSETIDERKGNDLSHERCCYLYGASALATAASSDSHLSPLASNFSLLYKSSSLVSVAYSALGPWRHQRTVQYSSNKVIRTFNNRINGATFLAEATVNAFRHVNIISRSPSATVFSLFCFDCDG
jgi:hypothetical protein